MTTIPDEAVEAAAEALRADNCPHDHPDDCDCSAWDREAEIALQAAAGTLERQAIQEFIETSGFYLARELSEAACYRQSLGTPCGKQHPHIEVVYGVSEEIVAEYLTRKGASDE